MTKPECERSSKVNATMDTAKQIMASNPADVRAELLIAAEERFAAEDIIGGQILETVARCVSPRIEDRESNPEITFRRAWDQCATESVRALTNGGTVKDFQNWQQKNAKWQQEGGLWHCPFERVQREPLSTSMVCARQLTHGIWRLI
jgi:hypothetical protein